MHEALLFLEVNWATALDPPNNALFISLQAYCVYNMTKTFLLDNRLSSYGHQGQQWGGTQSNFNDDTTQPLLYTPYNLDK